MTDPHRPSPIVQQAGLPNRTKLILTFLVIDVIVVAAVVWWIVS